MKKLLLTIALFTGISSSINAQQWDGGSSSNSTIHRIGRIGINTQTPQSRLHIKATNATNEYNTLFDGNSLSFLSNNTTSYINKRDNGRLMFRYGSGYTQAMSLFNGNLGIGEVTPTSRLHVKYFGNGTTPLATFEGSSNDTPQVIIKNGGGSGEGLLILSGGTGPSNAMQVSRYNGTSLMTVKGNGKVGIGSANPDQMLTVKGTIHSEEVIVDLDVPADYVFEKYYLGQSALKSNYTMPTLEEVEVFTKANHHLPEMPSAKTIQEEGLKVKEMANLLLQKVEELTLYTIEQEKRIKNLETALIQAKK